MRNKNELRSEVMRACAERSPDIVLDFVCESMKGMIDIKQAPAHVKQDWRHLLSEVQEACRKIK